ncbi:MAG TPA: V-type ATP synthase subunit K [Planctomycetota bacterium]|nr:V-type ATP synthase subunit K [Planctomycetota bacterium]
MEEFLVFLKAYFLESGLGLSVLGGMMAVALGGIGSAQGIRIASGQAAGVMSEKPELFGKLVVLIALPGTQGIYGLVTFILMCAQIKLTGTAVNVSHLSGLAMLAIGVGSGVVYWRSAVYQGETSAACINLVAKKPEEMGRAIILPVLVETYAVFAFLAAMLGMMWVAKQPILELTTKVVAP